jgi:molecular chaperone GrpE
MSEADLVPAEEVDYEPKWKRALADLENLRKKKNKQIDEAVTQGEADAIKKFLPVLDDMHRAMAAMSNPSATKEALLEGLQSVFNKFGVVLEQLAVQGFEAEGEKFTYEIMEAVAEVPTRDALPGTVVQEFEPGYTRGGRLLRAAKVSVAVEPKDES